MANGTSNGRRCIRIIASKNDLDLTNDIKRLLKKDEQQEIQCDLRFVNLDSPAINCHRKTLLLVSHKTSDEQDKWRATVCNLL